MLEKLEKGSEKEQDPERRSRLPGAVAVLPGAEPRGAAGTGREEPSKIFGSRGWDRGRGTELPRTLLSPCCQKFWRSLGGGKPRRGWARGPGVVAELGACWGCSGWEIRVMDGEVSCKALQRAGR